MSARRCQALTRRGTRCQRRATSLVAVDKGVGWGRYRACCEQHWSLPASRWRWW